MPDNGIPGNEHDEFERGNGPTQDAPLPPPERPTGRLTVSEAAQADSFEKIREVFPGPQHMFPEPPPLAVSPEDQASRDAWTLSQELPPSRISLDNSGVPEGDRLPKKRRL